MTRPIEKADSKPVANPPPCKSQRVATHTLHICHIDILDALDILVDRKVRRQHGPYPPSCNCANARWSSRFCMETRMASSARSR